jgi:uncharacterized membrane protein
MKIRPWMVSIFCILISLPLILYSTFSTPITTADLIDTNRVDVDCGEMKDDEEGIEEIDEGFSLECSDRIHRTENKIHGGLNIIIHMFGGSLLMLSAPFTFNSNILRRRKQIHRIAGYAFIIGGAITSIAAILMTLIFPYRFTPFTVFSNLFWSGLLLTALILALKAILQKKIKIHRTWMIRAYVVAAGPAFHRWFFFLTPLIGDFGISLGVVLCGEIIIRKIGLSTLWEMINLRSW